MRVTPKRASKSMAMTLEHLTLPPTTGSLFLALSLDYVSSASLPRLARILHLRTQASH